MFPFHLPITQFFGHLEIDTNLVHHTLDLMLSGLYFLLPSIDFIGVLQGNYRLHPNLYQNLVRCSFQIP